MTSPHYHHGSEASIGHSMGVQHKGLLHVISQQLFRLKNDINGDSVSPLSSVIVKAESVFFPSVMKVAQTASQ
jgi:hypothetical protein